MKSCYTLCRLSIVVLLVMLASGCEISGGVDRSTTPGAAQQAATATPTSEPATPAAGATASDPTPTVETTGSGFRIGLIDEPFDLLPYHTDAVDARITTHVSELLFPSPMLALNYSYTNTQVLDRMPSFENGDIELRPTEVYLDATGQITSTITEVLTDAQQLAITYHWNPDLRWSDGEAVTAADSLFAYELAQTLPLGEEAAQRLQLTERYEMIDPHTTRAILQPDLPDVNTEAQEDSALNLANTEYIQTYWTPLPQHLLSNQEFTTLEESEFARQPVGYGPYMVTQRSPGSIRMERNPYYALDPLPVADAASFAFFPDHEAMQTSLLNGGIDIALTDDATIELLDDLAAQQDEGTINVDYLPNPIWEHLDFNTDFTLLSDERARQAIAYGTNRQAMTDALFGGRVPVLDSWIVPDHWAAAPSDQLTQYPYDPDRARELLEELNLVDLDDDGIREQGIDFDSDDVLESSTAITLTLMITEDTPLRTAIAERFQEDMATIGLTVNVLELPPQELFGLNGPLFRRQFELTQFAWIASPDPRGFELWGCAAVPGPTNAWTGSNLPGWCHREANQTIITATTSLDFETRKEAYTRHQQIFTEELPVIPLFQRLTVVMHNPRIQGIRPDPIAPLTWNIAEWSRLE